MIKCKEIYQHASDYQDQQMPFLKRWHFRLHLMLCRHCYRFNRQFHLMLDGIKKMPLSQGSSIDETVKLFKESIKS